MPAFSPDNVTVIFVLGGPGAGKGTQSELLVKEFGFCHLSAGDLLRAEQNRDSSVYKDLIREHIRQGTVVPMEITIALLRNAMRDLLHTDARGRFLIDGFPRQMDQAVMFEEEVCPSKLTLFYTCTEEVMLERLLERGKTSGREDDNAESIKKRFHTYHAVTMPVIEYYRSKGQVAEIDGTKQVEEVHNKTKEAVARVL